MATQNQIRANRANALRSTGPKTAEGKQASSRNSTRHGMLSQTVVLVGESQDRFEDFLSSLTAQLKPRSEAEAGIVETMAIARWKQMRIWGVQKPGFDLEMTQLNSSCNIPATRAYMVFKKLADNSRVLDLQHRYETGYDRQFCRAYAFFLKLREKPETQLEDSDFSQMSFSFATATWDSPPEPLQDETQDETPKPPEKDEDKKDQPEAHSAGSAPLVVKQSRPAALCAMLLEVQPENQNDLPSKPAQTADLSSPQVILRNEPDSSAPLIQKRPVSRRKR
jgi:hypothetical protein